MTREEAEALWFKLMTGLVLSSCFCGRDSAANCARCVPEVTAQAVEIIMKATASK